MKRRTFLKTAVASSAMLTTAPFSQMLFASPTSRLHAQKTRLNLIPGESATEVWSFQKNAFSPVLVAEQGEELSILVKNDIDQNMTVHWHGVRVPNAMDGVPHLTQKPILEGESFRYQFASHDAGTYWYHPHTNSAEQLGRGLLGALIIKEPKAYPVDADQTIVIKDWLLDRRFQIDDDFKNWHEMSHAGRWGNVTTANGLYRPAFSFAPHSRVRLRIINGCTARDFTPDFSQFEHATLIAIDGHPVPPQPYKPWLIGSGMRIDVVVDVPATQKPLIVVDRTNGVFNNQMTAQLFSIQPKGRAIRASRLQTPPPALPENPLAKPNLNLAKEHEVVLKGGMMGLGMMRGMMSQVFWSINDFSMKESSDNKKPILSLKKNQSYLFKMVNDTSFAHPIHFHGHTFQVLSFNQKALKNPYWSDTVFLNPRESADIAFVADNEGLWMFHCHILGHQVSGMMGVIEVA